MVGEKVSVPKEKPVEVLSPMPKNNKLSPLKLKSRAHCGEGKYVKPGDMATPVENALSLLTKSGMRAYANVFQENFK